MGSLGISISRRVDGCCQRRSVCVSCVIWYLVRLSNKSLYFCFNFFFLYLYNKIIFVSIFFVFLSCIKSRFVVTAKCDYYLSYITTQSRIREIGITVGVLLILSMSDKKVNKKESRFYKMYNFCGTKNNKK